MEGGRAGEREGGREGEREGGQERGRVGASKGERERGREGGREGEKLMRTAKQTEEADSQSCSPVFRQHQPTALTISARSSCPSQFSSNASNSPAQYTQLLVTLARLNFT